jgi:4'-phosphopantetheinyl transferase
MKNEHFVYWKIQDQQKFVDLEWLSPTEFTHQQSFRFPKRKEDWLSGRWVAKSLLYKTSEHLQNCQLSDFSIENYADGSPLVIRNGEILPGSISISHRSGFASAAWSPDLNDKIGIDLEMIEPKPASFIEDYFTINEKNLVYQQKPEDQPVISSLIWSAKEAVMKALQTGLRIDTRQIEIRMPFTLEKKDWNSLEISNYPGGYQSAYVFWKRTESMIITLAVLSKTIIDEKTFPMNLIQVDD